jgi:hypothetical protein
MDLTSVLLKGYTEETPLGSRADPVAGEVSDAPDRIVVHRPRAQIDHEVEQSVSRHRPSPTLGFQIGSHDRKEV